MARVAAKRGQERVSVHLIRPRSSSNNKLMYLYFDVFQLILKQERFRK
jgi:hypothetical protein